MDFQQPVKTYRKEGQTYFSCQYLVVFCPKYRRKVLEGELKERLEEIFYDVAKEYDFNILDISIRKDCVHLIIDCNPDFGIMSCVKKLKNTSARILQSEYPKINSRLPSLWTRATLVSTLGTAGIDEVEEFYDSQKGK